MKPRGGRIRAVLWPAGGGLASSPGRANPIERIESGPLACGSEMKRADDAFEYGPGKNCCPGRVPGHTGRTARGEIARREPRREISGRGARVVVLSMEEQ